MAFLEHLMWKISLPTSDLIAICLSGTGHLIIRANIGVVISSGVDKDFELQLYHSFAHSFVQTRRLNAVII